MSIHRPPTRLVLSLCFMATAIILQDNALQAGDGSSQEDSRRQHGPASSFPAGDAARGKELYNASCVVCHGNGATGHIGPRLAGNAILANDQAFRKTVHEGRHMMPPLKDALTEEHIADILAWLRSLP